jgi:CheY-like chemotaxis protein
MYLRQAWELLLVDDEPDVLAVSRLALKGIKVYGIPLRIHTAASGREAREFLSRNRGPLNSELALAVVDVVMETDQAGLELCQFIREDPANAVTQLVVRTGQAGAAPERAVIDRYDISTYITKAEATEARLYTVVKGAVRQFLQLRVAHELSVGTHLLVSAVAEKKSRGAILEVLPEILNLFTGGRAAGEIPGAQVHLALFIDDARVGVGEYSAWRDEFDDRRFELRAHRPSVVTSAGHEFRHVGQDALISLFERPGDPKVEVLARTNMTPMPGFIVARFADLMSVARGLWLLTS